MSWIRQKKRFKAQPIDNPGRYTLYGNFGPLHAQNRILNRRLSFRFQPTIAPSVITHRQHE